MNPRLAPVASRRRTWLVTGGAGFIGSHLVETLLRMGQRVRCLDSFVTGHRRNLEEASAPSPADFELIEGDIRDPAACAAAVRGVDVVLHQAALASVPRSIQDPLATHESNVTGFLQILRAAREAGVRRVVYASSSSVYGDDATLPKVEDRVGRQLSPYAVSKYADELYARVFGPTYGLELVGLRYFNVYGSRQDPNGPYAAVIPLWFKQLVRGETVHVNGDGETSRDFCHVDDAVQANLLAAITEEPGALGEAYNVAVGERTTLNELFTLIREQVARSFPGALGARPEHRDFRAGDVRHSLADVSKARRLLGYEPAVRVREGLARSATWYLADR